MKQPYQIISDIWEGNPDIDAGVLKENGVIGIIARINDMNGGHHMDERFPQNWAMAKQFDVQGIYFVYNPWKNGQENYNWLMAHLPADYGRRRLFVDIEVRYSGYSPATYAAETAKFCRMAGVHFPVTRYSGAGFLSILTPWPADEEYWWAAYPAALDGTTTWETYREKLEKLELEYWCAYCPGTPRMWQCSGDDVKNLPGFGGRAVDVNVFPGTLEDARAWFGCEKEQSMDWKQDAMLFYTAKSGWTNKGFDAIIGHAGQEWDEPNPELKPIETQTAAEGKPFIGLWDFGVDYYSINQYKAEPQTWPPLAQDWPYQMFVRAFTSRDPQAIIVRVMTNKNRAGKVEDPLYISRAAQWFMGRVSDWLAANKPNCKLLLCTSNEFISTYSPQMNDWAYKYPSVIEQMAVLPLDASFPQATDKIRAYISTRATWEMWYYKGLPTRLVLYNGSGAALRTWLGFAPKDTNSPTQPAGLASSVANGNVILTWSPATDNVGVTGYQVYRDGVKALVTTSLSASFSNQAPGTYVYGVSAFDAAGNESAPATISVVVPVVEKPVTRAEFDALVKQLAQLELTVDGHGKAVQDLVAQAHPKAHTHTTGQPV